ncbi:iron complex outermembrane recepter protein [Salinimicrobium catena]|uniref:Iron complex outermembrane recepter protein n=1 Tax=Salinimicrobium catena TaxID=390640 RepID=A0A1H5JHY5_9FLAO|nr:TonB-dependent receptor [Salinimicrobium catena]SDK87852.1 iron complex outermembrane recepter protein [Salinimicrobium catena]SEE52165.1 iron complex outermembrane recepter protein [Salinimicrobium catena]
MKNLFLIATILLGSFNLVAQQYQVSGKVTDGEIPLTTAIVRVEGASQGTQTNSQGEYSLSLEAGKYVLIFSNGNQKRIPIDLSRNMILDVDMSDAAEELEEVFLSAVRVTADSPITYSNLSNEEIEDRNLGQDIPSLMQYMPGVVTTSDAGAGIGYSSIRVRGTESRGVNVTINGVPYNDAESQGTFWVNLGDFASSVENLQLQRGVGTSTNGAGAFGASINVLTDRYKVEPSAEISNSFGSYNTRKHTVKFSSGLFKDHWEFAGRASVIKSDGYIDRASSDLKSYFFQGTYVDGGTLVKALTFGGSEVTYQAWDGIDADQLQEDRRFNPAGAYIDDAGNLQFYENHVDDYKQDHYQLLWNQSYGSNWSSNMALHYTYGRGFYESYRADEDLAAYGLQNFTANGEEITESDLVTRKWLVNDFYGTTFNVQYEEDNLKVIAGGAWNNYLGDHFGEIVYTRFARSSSPLQRYYDNQSQKSDFNVFGKATVAISENFSLYGDLQLRRLHYEVDGVEEEETPFFVDDRFTFFNPKAGMTYEISDANQLYFSFARAHREPNRSDYENGNPEPEELNDYELGWRFKTQAVQINTNLYYMDYQNQLVLTGELNDVGAPIRRNSGSSYRAGLEVDAAVKFSDKFTWRPNVAISRNKNDEWFANWDGELRSFGKTDISYSPEVVASNILEFRPVENLELKLLSKYVGEQYMSNLENEAALLEDYFINDFNIQYTWKDAPLFEEIVFTGLVNNIFDEEYVSNGYYYTYDWEGVTYEGAGYYPQATRNFLAGVTLRF